MKRIVFIALIISCMSCTYSQDNIIFNKLRKLNDGEVFVAGDRVISEIKGESYFRYTVFVKNGTNREKVLEFKNAQTLYMFQDNKRFLILLDIGLSGSSPEYNGDPLFYIDGTKGIIENLGPFLRGYFILEEPMVIINKNPQRRRADS